MQGSNIGTFSDTKCEPFLLMLGGKKIFLFCFYLDDGKNPTPSTYYLILFSEFLLCQIPHGDFFFSVT